MAHYAKVIDNKVVQVIVADQDFIDNYADKSLGEWVQTSYNTRAGKHICPETGDINTKTPLRKNYAGIGFTYDEDRDAFIPPQPFVSWTLNEDSCLWEPPVAYPNDGLPYKWDDVVYGQTGSGWVEIEE